MASKRVLKPKRTLGPAVAKFFRNFSHEKGIMAGQPFVLDPFQQDDVDLIYEVDANNVRVWRSSLVGWARGLGKSPIAAGSGVLELVTRKAKPDVIVAAAARHQAGIIQDFGSGFVRNSPLNDHCRVLRNAIMFPRNDGSMRTVSADGHLQHGLSISALLRDEIHSWLTEKQVELYWALETAMHKQHDSTSLDITTAGWNKRTLLGERYDAALKTHTVDVDCDGYRVVARDRDAGSLMIWRGAPEDADVMDPATWRKAYPASWISEKDIARLAATTPENVFRRLILNQWTEAESTWLPLGVWDARKAKGDEAKVALTEPVILAFVGRYRGDAAALVGWSFDGRAFTIEIWEGDDDYLVPREKVEEALEREFGRRKVKKLVVDDYGWLEEVAAWRRRWPGMVELPVAKNRRQYMVKACSRFYSDVVNGQVTHDGNRRAGKHLAQVVAKPSADGQGVYITTDPDTELPIVGALALVIGYERSCQPLGPEPWAIAR